MKTGYFCPLRPLVILFQFFTGTGIAAPGPGVSNDFAGKRVLIVGIDGLRPDALRTVIGNGTAPNLKALVDDGIVTWNAFAGGPPGGAQQQSTVSGPGWTTIFTGTWIDRHGVSGNSTAILYDRPGGYLVSKAPHFAKRLHEKVPTARVDLLSSWDWINTYLAAGQPGEFGYRYNGVGASYADRDLDVKTRTLAHLATKDPDVLQLHFDQVDGAGHSSGFNALNPAYLSAISAVDRHLGDVFRAIDARPQRAAEQWNILVTTDHGGLATGHGGQSLDEREIFVIARGPAFPPGKVSKEALGHDCIVPTIFKVLGVPQEAAWQWSGTAFGLAPLVEVHGAGTHALLAITQPSSGILAGCMGIEVRRNGQLLATLSPEAVEYVDQPPVPAPGAQAFSYELKFLGTPEIRTGTTTLGTDVSAAPGLSEDLVLSMAFEGNATDGSGRGNHGTLTGGTANYAPGKGGGQAVIVNASQYVRLGALTDLRFGAGTDFTVGFWVKTAGGWSGDPAFISNKNWASGANGGWIIAGENNGPNWQWNLKGADAGRKDFDPSGVALNDNQWHHIGVVHSRAGNATFYHDGVSIATVAISGAGSADTALAFNIGRDASGSNAFDVDVALDDLKIWRRALSPAEIAVIAPDGRAAWTTWLAANFTPTERGNPEISGPGADPDRDGIVNLHEYVFGTPPLAHNPTPVSSTSFGIRFPEFHDGRGAPGFGYEAGNVRTRIYYTESPGETWRSLATDFQTELLLEPRDAKTRFTTLQLAPGNRALPKGFFRLQFELVP